ncbi:uncharacterized protein LOC128116829 [Peromyscus californicus insignis]|uniref:uncharacterized protein LOC128116829 n=1 Tax=Peromyscus californicus insignis TaxID=564181 RepID=UPI0022A6A070|nr:uncharacterized protein LOC128116829 [Peromyscus californicus insignis]
MLLPLLGACAVVGPFQGPEWEPVRGLLSQDQSCRDPRCCGNLLVFCLFLIWQIQQYWYRVSRTSKRNAIKVPPQRWAVLSTRCETFFGMIHKFFTHGKIRNLDVPVQQWTQRQRWGYRRGLRQQWATQYLLSPQNSCQDLPWVVHSSSEPIICTPSFSSTCLLPQDNSWEVWQVPWCPSSSQAHPSLDMCQRMEPRLAPSPEKLVPMEPVSLKYNSTSTALAISLPNFPLVHRSKFCLRGLLPGPLNQQLEPPTKKSLDSPQDPSEPQGETQTAGREYSEDSLQYTDQRKGRKEVASEIQASGGPLLPVDLGVEKDGEAKALGCGGSVPEREKQDQMGTEDREPTEKLWKKTQREPGDRNPSTQAHAGENQEEIRCKTDTATQTPEWGNQEDAVETLALGKKNEKEARGKEEAEAREQGLGTRSWIGRKNSEDSQMLSQGTQDPIGGNTGTETEAEEGGSKGQMGSEDGVKIRTSGRENLRETKQQDSEETRALEWEKQGWVRTQNEVQTPAGEERGWSGGENARKTHASKKEDQNLSRHEVQVGMKKLKEIREEDWVVIQAPWWGNQRLVLIAIDRGLKISCWGNQGQIGGEHTAGIRALESDRRQGGDDGTNNLPPEAETQGQLRGKTPLETHAVDKLAPGRRNQREAGGDVDVKTRRPGSKNQGQLTETRGSRSTRWRSWGQARGEKASENGALEKKTWGKAGSEDGRKIQRARRKTQRVLRKVNGKTYLLEWKTPQKFRKGNDADIQKQGKRSLRNFTGDGGPESRASRGEDQRQSVGEMDGKIQTQGQRIQSKGRAVAAEIPAVGAQSKRGAEESDQSPTWRRGDKGQVRRKDVVRSSLQGDSSVREGPTGRKHSLAQPASLIFRHGTPRHKQPVAGNGIDSAPCPQEHLSRQGPAPARKHRGGVSGSSQRAQPGSQRRQERDKRVEPAEAPSLTCQHLHPQSQPSSVFPSLLCPQVRQAAAAPASVPVLTTPSKWPALKKSKHLLLESLMKRRIAHLRWGLPRRILESYLLFHFLEACALPRAGVRLPGSRTDRDRQRQQEQHCEPQGSLLGPESPGRSQSRPVPERKSSKLSTQVQALEKGKPPKSEPTRSSVPPKKPRRIRPPGGAREPPIQEEAPKAKNPAPGIPRPAAESRSWCGPGQVQELSTESSRGRKMVRPGVSHVEERASSRVRAPSCTEGHSQWKKECVPREASELPRLKCQQSPYLRSGSVGSAEGTGAWQPPFLCSAHTSSFKGNVHSATARLSMTILSKMPWSPQLAKSQLSAPFLTPRNPTPFPKVSALYTKEDSIRVPTALERALEPPGHCCTGVIVPKMESVKEHEAPGNPNRAPRNPAVSQKFGFMRHLRYFLRQYGLKK